MIEGVVFIVFSSKVVKSGKRCGAATPLRKQGLNVKGRGKR